VLPLFIKKLKARIQFENKNFKDPSATKIGEHPADYAFEVSSEGELEQVKGMIQMALDDQKVIELIYCSESVEHQCQKLVSRYPHQVRLLRLPLITYWPFSKMRNPGNWLTAKKFYLCRYDFFPELVFYGQKSEVEFSIIWSSLKNYFHKSQGLMSSWYYRYVYSKFDKIIAATDLDKNLLLDKFHIEESRVKSYDFRPMQITSRQSKKDSAFEQGIPFFKTFKIFLDEYPRDKKVIFGSYWDAEHLLLSDNAKTFIDEGHLLTLVPHQLNRESLNSIKASVERITGGLPVYEIYNDMGLENLEQLISDMKSKPGILLLNLKGVLCELYTLYGHAYVGGGYGISVHSLLEPFVAGCMVYCGPKVHRSTEYDIIREKNPDHIVIIDNPIEFINSVKANDIENLSKMDDFENHYHGHLKPVTEWLGFNHQGDNRVKG